MKIYIFEGKSHDPHDASLFFDHSLSLHKTFESAKAALELEKNYLLKQLYEFQEDKLIDGHDGISIHCLLIDCYSNERILTVSQWSVLD